jgi:ElaB protein
VNEANDSKGALNTSDASSLSRTAVSGTMESAVSAPASDSEGGGLQSSGPAVLAQPVEGAEGQRSKLPATDNTTAAKAKRELAVVKDVLAGAQDAIVTRCRVVSESTDDFVHDSPWNAIAADEVTVGALPKRNVWWPAVGCTRS